MNMDLLNSWPRRQDQLETTAQWQDHSSARHNHTSPTPRWAQLGFVPTLGFENGSEIGHL